MSDSLQADSTPAIIQAIEANQFAFFSLLRHWARAEVRDDADLLWCITDVPLPVCNFVLRAQLASGTIDRVIESAIARRRSRRVPMLWYVGPATRPVNLGTYLQAHGFVHERKQPCMAVDLQALPDALPPLSGFTLERVSEAETLEHWYAAAAAGFGIPDSIAPLIRDSWRSI